jgi:selenocysteine-specific elongation factor
MVAGAAGMDAVLLVVAADDGVMPQTREHLEILTLLGVQHGFVALTKIDRVDADARSLAASEVQRFVQGTFLEGKPIVPLSNVTFEGFDPFYEALAALVHGVPPKPLDGLFRLPLDRSFSVQGYGTVVSGIPVRGSARLDDEVVLLPHGVTGRIRGIEVYGRTSDTVLAGQCAALNVRHFDPRMIRRGDTLTVPGFFKPERWFGCTLRLLSHEKLALKHGVSVKFHTGTAEVTATLYAMQGDVMRGGEEHLVQIRTDAPVVAGPGDYFIVRSLSPVQTVGGGMVIESLPGKLRRNRPGVTDDLRQRGQLVQDDRRFVEYCLKTARGLAARDNELAVRVKLPLGRVQAVLEDLASEKVVVSLSPKLLMHQIVAADATRRIAEQIGGFHRESPESPGMTLEQLRTAAGLDHEVLDGLVALLKADGRVVEHKGRFALAEHRATFRDEDVESIETIESLYREQTFAPPSAEDVATRTGLPLREVQRVLRILREHEQLVQVSEGMLFHREAVERARKLLVDYIRKEGRLESVRFKYLLDTTRKFALPLLDYFDRVGVTRRDGNTRYLR